MMMPMQMLLLLVLMMKMLNMMDDGQLMMYNGYMDDECWMLGDG